MLQAEAPVEATVYYHRYPFGLIHWEVWELTEAYELLKIGDGWAVGKGRARAAARYCLDQYEATRYL